VQNGAENPHLRAHWPRRTKSASTTATFATAAARPVSPSATALLGSITQQRVKPARANQSSVNNVDVGPKTIVYIGQGRQHRLALRQQRLSIYYTFDGPPPRAPKNSAGASPTTSVAAITFDQRENDARPRGNAMWWKGTIPNAPCFHRLKYKVSLWHSDNTSRNRRIQPRHQQPYL